MICNKMQCHVFHSTAPWCTCMLYFVDFLVFNYCELTLRANKQSKKLKKIIF